jgi:hypothetical protein
MLKNKITLSSVLIVAIGISAAAFFAVFKGEAQTQQNDNKLEAKILRAGNSIDAELSKKELDDAATPIVDYDASTANSETANRIAKNGRYDGGNLVKADVGTRAVEVFIHAHYDWDDLPFGYSNLVVEGKVTDSAAFLSNDKTTVYSEFTIRVTDVIKTSDGIAVNKNDSIITERRGGRVKYSSGKVIRYTLVGQGSPMVGKKYLFFLEDAQQGNYNILTAYELQGNKVFALDGSHLTRRERDGLLPFDKHNNRDYKEFKKDVEKAKSNPKSLQDRRSGA